MEQRVPFSEWTQVSVQNLRVLIADRAYLTKQGLAGATIEELGNSVMYFPIVDEAKLFDNQDYGFGPVPFDIKIAFLDEDWKVLSIDDMPALTGSSKPPPGTKEAIEGLPSVFRATNFGRGALSPIIVKVRYIERHYYEY